MDSPEIFQKLLEIQKRGKGSQESYKKLEEALTSEEDKKELERFFNQSTLTEEEKSKLTRELSENVPNANLQLYNPAVYLALLPYAKLMYSAEQNPIPPPEDHAYKLAILFKDPDKALNYLDVYYKNHNKPKQIMHDACNFALPTQGFDLKTWQVLAQKYLGEDQFRTLILPQASAIQEIIKSSSHGKGKPNAEAIKNATKEVDEIYALFKKLERKHGDLGKPENSKLVSDMTKMLVKLNVPDVSKKDIEEQYQELLKQLFQKQMALTELGVRFDEQLTLSMLMAFKVKNASESSAAYKYFLDHGLTQDNFQKFSSLKRQDDDVKIPDIKIDGATIGHPGYYLMKIPVANESHAARAACLGKLTNCCQSLSGEAGESCVIHGLTSPNGGFYVLCKGDNITNPQVSDKVMGQCWAWRSKSNAIVFDSIETSSKDADTKKIVSLFYRNLAKTLVVNNHTDRVASGASSGITQEVGIGSGLNQLEEFVDYSGYCDSKNQLVLYDKARPFYLYEIDEDSTVATLKMVEDTMLSPQPLTESPSFIAALNWAILNNRNDLLLKIMDITRNNYPERLASLESTIQMMKGFITSESKGFDLDMVDGSLLEMVNTQGFTPLQSAASKNNLEDITILINKGANINAKDKMGQTALMQAIHTESGDVALALIENGADVNLQNNLGETALMLAIHSKLDDVALRLLEKGVNINLQNKEGETALMLAIKLGRGEVAQAILKKGANLNLKNNQGETALTHAINHQDQDLAIALIEQGANIKTKDRQGETPLMLAIDKGCEKVALYLIEKGVDVNLASNNGATALMRATLHAQGEVVEALLKKGANIHAKDSQNHTALVYGTESSMTILREQNLSVLEKLIDHGADVNSITPGGKGNTLLFYAIDKGFSSLALKCIEKGANVEEKFNRGESLLLYAISQIGTDNNFEKVAKALIEHGADVNARDTTGSKDTALLKAITSSQFDLALSLIENGASIDTANDLNVTPWQKVIESAESSANDDNYIKLVRAFVERGANLNEKDSSDNTILINAVTGGNLEFIQELATLGADINAVDSSDNNLMMYLILTRSFSAQSASKLIDAGLNINAQNAKGETSLLLALKSFPRMDKNDFVMTLLKNNADVNINDNDGNSPLHFALKNKHDKISLELIKKGADVNAVNNNGESLLMLAAKMNLGNVVQELLQNGAKINEPKETEAFEALLKDNPSLRITLEKPSTPLEKPSTPRDSSKPKPILFAGPYAKTLTDRSRISEVLDETEKRKMKPTT